MVECERREEDKKLYDQKVQWLISTEKSLKTNSLFGDFTEDKVGKTLLLRFHREVGALDVADALGEALKPRLGDEKASFKHLF